MLRTVTPDDAPAIADIYNHYIRSSLATFEEELLAPDDMRYRIAETTKTYPWLVCEEEDKLLGYAYGRRWRERAAYRYAVEASIYLDPAALGKGIGSVLLGALLCELRNRGLHCVMGGVSLPNEASVALLEKFGFRPVAHFKEVGYKFDRWIDVGYWQLML
ncbi:MAG TPA: GNAT family N-acetyltransferase [Terracidiphilus sp.]|nr:GNAT family N-acetyltransferase [Terracidiphilus sp.]